MLLQITCDNYIDVLKEVLKYSKDLNAKEHSENTALIIAVKRGHVDVVKELLKHENTDIDEVDKNEFTALHFATLYGNVEITKALLENGCQVNISNVDNETPLHYGVNSPEITSLLLQFGAKINVQDYDGETPIHNALRLFSYDENVTKDEISARTKSVLQVLLKWVSSEDLNIRNGEGHTCLDIAIQRKYTEVARMILMKKNLKTDISHSMYPIRHFLGNKV